MLVRIHCLSDSSSAIRLSYPTLKEKRNNPVVLFGWWGETLLRHTAEEHTINSMMNTKKFQVEKRGKLSWILIRQMPHDPQYKLGSHIPSYGKVLAIEELR